jgi:hypothetical protein
LWGLNKCSAAFIVLKKKKKGTKRAEPATNKLNSLLPYIFARQNINLFYCLPLRMKKTLAALASLLSLVLLTMPTSCYYDNEEDLYGPDTTACDTAAIRYSVEIKKILEDNCNSCHLPTGVTYSSIPFETHAQLQEVALNGKLVDRTNSISAPMPQTGLMDKCSRLKLEAWVKAGAPNN